MAQNSRSQVRGPWSPRSKFLPPQGSVLRAGPPPRPPSGGSPADAGISVVLVAAPDFPRQPDYSALLHLFRTGFQTVGQPLLMLSALTTVGQRIELEQDRARRQVAPYPSFTQPAAAAGMPLPMMLTTSLRLESETQETRLSASGPSIHIFRTGFQTVAGVSLALLHRTSTRVDAEQFEVRSPVPTLHVFRPGYATVGQPLALLHRASNRVESELYEVRSAAPLLHLFRTGFQTVGQPLALLAARPATRVDAGEDFIRRAAARYPSSNLAATAGMPLPLMRQAQRDHSLYASPQVMVLGQASSYQLLVVAPSAVSFQPLQRLERKPQRHELYADRFAGMYPSGSMVKATSIDVSTTVYDFQFLNVVFEVHDLNAQEWQEHVRYHTNHARLMQAFRQYGAFTISNVSAAAAVTASPSSCADALVWTDDAADAGSWAPPSADAGVWTPPAADSGAWAPPAADTGSWANQTDPGAAWTDNQRFC